MILNGATLNYNEVTGETSIRVTDGKELTIADGEYVKGGTITNDDAAGKRVITVISVGGIAGDGAALHLELAAVSYSDTATVLGGVVVGDGSAGPGKLNMTGGTVDGNTATLGEGGGIYIQGKGEISGGRITNNVRGRRRTGRRPGRWRYCW